MNANDLRAVLDYDPETGAFTRLASHRSDRVGKQPGGLNNKGYRQIRLNGVLYCAHKLAWLHFYGVEAPEQIDHINGDKDDNRISNLRLASNKQNQENVPLQINNTTGFRGVSYEKALGKYRAYVCHDYHTYLLGFYDSAERAGQVAKGARDLLFTHHKTEFSA